MFELNPNSDTPLYMQIVEQTKLAIAKGYFRNGDKYPSVRELSRELLINQATVSKAFKELDKQGIIETKAGIEMSKKLQDDLIEARYLGNTLDEIIAMYEKAGDYNDR